jgi:hypothetical protein
VIRAIGSAVIHNPQSLSRILEAVGRHMRGFISDIHFNAARFDGFHIDRGFQRGHRRYRRRRAEKLPSFHLPISLI